MSAIKKMVQQQIKINSAHSHIGLTAPKNPKRGKKHPNYKHGLYATEEKRAERRARVEYFREYMRRWRKAKREAIA